MTVAFTGGGTAGHINPGLAVAQALVSLLECRVVWIGNREGMDRSIVERAGIEFLGVSSGKFRRELSFENVSDLFKIAAGWTQSRKILKKLKPALLFSKGGFVSVPPCAAAAALGIPVFSHESDLSPGLATRLNARHSRVIFTAYAQTAAALGPKALVSGNPIRSSITRGDPARGRSFLGFSGDRPIVLFLGGSQGATQINDIAAACVQAMAGRDCDIAHQTGREESTPPASDGYRPFPYLHEELADVIASSDLVVSRAGAGGIWECGSLGKPMILVPLASGATRGDQVLNARLFADSGAALTMEGPDAEPQAVLSAIRGLLAEPGRMAGMSSSVMRLCPPDAAMFIARRIAQELGAQGLGEAP